MVIMGSRGRKMGECSLKTFGNPTTSLIICHRTNWYVFERVREGKGNGGSMERMDGKRGME